MKHQTTKKVAKRRRAREIAKPGNENRLALTALRVLRKRQTGYLTSDW